MSGDEVAVLDSEQDLSTLLVQIMTLRREKVLRVKDPAKRDVLAQSYNFKAEFMNEQYSLSLPYVGNSSN
jgi:hypothetical protein